MKQPATARKKDWWIYTAPILLVLTICFHLILYARTGKLGLIVYYLGPILVTLLAIVFLITGLIYSLVKRPFYNKWRAFGFAGLLLFPLSFFVLEDQGGNFVSAYPSPHEKARSKVVFRLPLDTFITVGWGGNDAATNYHVTAPDQRWAYDLLVTQQGRTHIGDSTKFESYLCYGMPVLAPAPGTVVAAFDSVADKAIGDLSETVYAGGNQLIIKVAEKEYLFLCHLKPKSIRVKKGDEVVQGQVLAQVGNSGHTSEPHLHIHLQDTPDDFLGEGIPLYFSNYIADGQAVAIGMPTGGFDHTGKLTGQIVRNQPQH